jgi:hypothetical protein
VVKTDGPTSRIELKIPSGRFGKKKPAKKAKKEKEQAVLFGI